MHFASCIVVLTGYSEANKQPYINTQPLRQCVHQNQQDKAGMTLVGRDRGKKTYNIIYTKNKITKVPGNT